MGKNYNPWHLFGTNHIGNSNPAKPTTQNFGNEQTYHHKLQPQINQEVPNKKKSWSLTKPATMRETAIAFEL